MDEPADEPGFTDRWMRRTGTRLSGAVGFSDVPGTAFRARRASSSFFLNLGTSRTSRVLLSQISLRANDDEGKHSHGLEMVGSSSFAKWTLAFFGGKLHKDHFINHSTKRAEFRTSIEDLKP